MIHFIGRFTLVATSPGRQSSETLTEYCAETSRSAGVDSIGTTRAITASTGIVPRAIPSASRTWAPGPVGAEPGASGHRVVG